MAGHGVPQMNCSIETGYEQQLAVGAEQDVIDQSVIKQWFTHPLTRHGIPQPHRMILVISGNEPAAIGTEGQRL